MNRLDFFHILREEGVDFTESDYESLESNQKIRALLNIMIFLYQQNQKLEERIAKLETKKTTQKRKS